MSDLAIFLSGGLVVLLVLGVPIAFSLIALTIGGLYIAGINPVIFAQRMLAGTEVSSLLAVPGFILAGDLMSAGGLSKRLVRFASAIFGVLTGGLSIATVVAGTFFGAISGSAPATTAAVGSVMIDELERRGYRRNFAAALATAVGPLGQMIPPSIPMVVWGVLAEQSIAKLFLAGVFPGLLAALGCIGVCVWYAIESDNRVTRAEFWFYIKDGIWALLAPVIILGGIYGGVFTPTEASMVAVIYGLITGLFIYHELSLHQLYRTVLQSLKLSGMIMFIICAAFGYAYLMATTQIPLQIAEAFLSISSNPVVILLLINLLLLVLGAVMDNVSAMVILSGVLTTIGTQFGMDPIQLGAMVVINFAVGMVTPPVGYSIFVASAISGLKIEQIVNPLLPFLFILIVLILLVTYERCCNAQSRPDASRSRACA